VLDVQPCVRLVPVFAGLAPAQQAEVARFARRVRVAPGDVVARAGEPSSRLFVVHTGRVKLRWVSATGHETIVRVVEPGEVAGEEAFLTGEPPATDAVALEPSQLCVFDHADLAGLLTRLPGIGVGMLRALAGKLTSAERMVAALTSSDVGARVAAYLLDLPATWDDAHATVRLPLPKNQVAAYLGTTPETLSRRLAAFAREGLVEVGPRRDVVILDPVGLGRRAAS
jgi:CRP/FNR family transcriptional regulator